MKNISRLSTLAVLSAALVIGLSGCGKDEPKQAAAAAPEAQKTEIPEVKIGIVGEHNDEWKHTAELLEKQGIKLTLVKFADYTLPNRALNDGDIDLNAFQHVAFLDAENEQKGFKNVRVQDTLICPLGVYSQKIKSIDEIKDGDTIAIPNDATNGGRALKVLELSGLIKLDPSKGYVPTVRDITENPKNIKIYEVDAGNTPSLLPDVAAAIINNNYCIDNGIDPAKDAIFSDGTGVIDPQNPYINIVAAREADKDNPVIQKVLEVYRCKENADIINKEYNGSAIPVFKY